MYESPADCQLAEGVTDGLAELAASLRAQGSRVGMGELLTAHQALEAVDCTSREDARLALRAVLCSDRGDLAKFDLAFLAVYGSGAPLGHSPFDELGGIEQEALPHAGLATGGATPPPSADGELKPVPAAWSDVELLRHKDFATYTDAEMALARLLIAQLARRGPTRLSRRTRPSRRRGHTPDLRRVVRASLRTAGEPIDRHWRAPSRRPRPVVLVCDVSGSMTPYARMLLQYLHASVAARRRVEAFAFGTRLTRITHELGGRDHDRALDRAAEAVTDFSGGTRIGDAAGDAEPRPWPPSRARRGGRDPVRRVGPRRPRAAADRDGAPSPQRPPAGVAEPAGRPPRVRAADPRHACGDPAHGRAAGGKLAWPRSSS